MDTARQSLAALCVLAVLLLAGCGGGARGLPSGFPIYPGAQAGHNYSNGLQIDITYVTPDAPAKVTAWYGRALGSGGFILTGAVADTQYWQSRANSHLTGSLVTGRNGRVTTIHIFGS